MRRAWTLIVFAVVALPSFASEPFRVISNVFSVGVSDATVFVIATPKGLVLLDTGAASEYDKIRDNMKKLGFEYYDIRIMLLSHVDREHAGNAARIRRETGARLMVAEHEVPLLAKGGPVDATSADQQLREGDRVTMGGLLFIPHITPACTTWTTQVRWERKAYNVVFAGCHPGKNVESLRAIEPDIFLGARGSYFDLERKYARRNEKPNPFIDPAGYRKFVDESPRR
jgi:metallo-beta-lactamase class B